MLQTCSREVVGSLKTIASCVPTLSLSLAAIHFTSVQITATSLMLLTILLLNQKLDITTHLGGHQDNQPETTVSILNMLKAFSDKRYSFTTYVHGKEQ